MTANRHYGVVGVPGSNHPREGCVTQRVEGHVSRPDTRAGKRTVEDVPDPVGRVGLSDAEFVKTCDLTRGKRVNTASTAGEIGMRRIFPFFVSRNVTPRVHRRRLRTRRQEVAEAGAIAAGCKL